VAPANSPVPPTIRTTVTNEAVVGPVILRMPLSLPNSCPPAVVITLCPVYRDKPVFPIGTSVSITKSYVLGKPPVSVPCVQN